MYAPKAFALRDQKAFSETIRAYPLATLVIHGATGLRTAYVPFVIHHEDDSGIHCLLGHMARANPFWLDADGTEVIALFGGPDAYVSPSFYPSKAEHGRVVPTWNYLRVEARGILRIEDDPARVRPYVEIPTAVFESSRPKPWSTDDAPAEFIEALFRGIVGVRIENCAMSGVSKLSQNRTDADRAGVISGLDSKSANGRARALHDLMLAINDS